MAYTPPASTAHTITLPTNESITYTLRSLKSDDDISKWTEFCASIFSYKDNPPPPSYFARHFYNDPQRDIGLIRVLVCTKEDDRDEEIVSSVRIFRRTLAVPNGASVDAGGIGEVCTSPEHQRRGLSKILLTDALNIMKDETCGMSCSLLHASPTFRPVYAKAGYECVTSHWSVVSVKLDELPKESNGPYECTCNGETIEWKVRRALFPQDTSRLFELHRSYSEARCITIQRTEKYWNDYVSKELGDTLCVLTKSTIAEERIVAWMSVRKRDGRYQLREFGYDTNDDFTVAASVQHLLPMSLQVIADEQNGELHSKSIISLHMPTIVWNDIRDGGGDHSFLDVDYTIEENDYGWMYLNFDENKSNVLELTKQQVGMMHLVWPTDSF